MKLRFTITDLLIFLTAIGAYIAILTQATFVLWHVAAASAMMGLLVGTVIGVGYGGRQWSAWVGVVGSFSACCCGICSDMRYWQQLIDTEHALGLAVIAIFGAIPFASAAALFWRSENDILKWTTVYCLLAVMVPTTIAILFLFGLAMLELNAHPNKAGLFLLGVIIWLVMYAGMMFAAATVGVIVGILAIALRQLATYVGIIRLDTRAN